MLKRPNTGRGLFYTRDSGGEHENTPGEYVRWAQRQAIAFGVSFSGTPEQIETMIREGRSYQGDIFLDYGVKGNQLQRPGLDALFRVALTDSNITHVLIPRRDRLARPDDPLDALKLEAKLREGGLTLAFMDRTLTPMAHGQHDLGESIVALVDYDRAGKERRDLAQKILYAQLTLAKAGFSTGGRPPFGFRRWLVNVDGTQVRQLEEGESVRKAGHHVVWLPGPKEELDLICRILEMLQASPASRVAATLTLEKIPSPDSGRVRIDGGIAHTTSGVWHQQTIVNIARNPLLRAIVEYGRRSMGDRLRFSPDGPRELTEDDRLADGKEKVVVNPESVRVTAPARFDTFVNQEDHARLLTTLDERAGTQRGKPRSKDPGRNPLGGRIFDMNCTWLMHRQPYNGSFRYLCGLYQQSHGAKCKHNNVDGIIATRFLLGCIRQRLLAQALREKLEQKIRTIAERELCHKEPDTILATKQTALANVRTNCERAGENLARAEGPDQYKAVASVFEKLKIEQAKLETEVRQLERTAKSYDINAEVNAALAKLDRLGELVNAPQDLHGVTELFRQTNARIFFRFAEGVWKKRKVTKIASGIVTFGQTPPPITPYEGPTGRDRLNDLTTNSGAATLRTNESKVNPVSSPGGEDGSLGNVNRGERI
jgi:hypothetical protein